MKITTYNSHISIDRSALTTNTSTSEWAKKSPNNLCTLQEHISHPEEHALWRPKQKDHSLSLLRVRGPLL